MASTPSQAINEKYRQQLERSGCTQMSELQGCDIHKSKVENAKAGFVTEASVNTGQDEASSPSPYAGQWVAKYASGGTVASILIKQNETVWINGKQVKAKRSDGALVFRDGKITYTIQGDRRLQGEDVWNNFEAGTTGLIHSLQVVPNHPQRKR